MLPLSHRHLIEEFLKSLELLLSTTQASANRELLNPRSQELQNIFQQQILTLSSDDSNADDRIQPYLTEIHRLMRLLPMDVMFLVASRQAVTSQQRQAAFEDRIKSLIGLCEAILQKPSIRSER